MRLREVEVRNWRGLDRRTLGGLHDGVNLVLGPNEAGKSRLYESIRFGLFEGHKGTAQHKADLQSWSGAETPFVRIALEFDGVAYEVQKQFLKGGFAVLAGGGVTLKGDEAEERLRQLLGTRAGNNRGLGLDDLGIWPMLMVEQGASRAPVHAHMNADGRATLHKRLSSEIGVAAVGPQGQRLLDLVEREFARYFTATGQPGALIRDARKQLADAEEALTKARAALERQSRLAVELGAARDQRESLTPRLGTLEVKAKEAAQRAQKAEQMGAHVQRLEAEHKLAAAAHAAAQKDAQRRLACERDVEQAKRLVAEASSALDLATVRGQEIEDEATAAAAGLAAAQMELKSARDAYAAAMAGRQRMEFRRRKETLVEQLRRLSEHDAELEELARTLAGLPKVTAPAIAALREKAQAAATAKARLQGAAVALSIQLTKAASIDGQAHAAGAVIDFEIVENRTIELGDFGQLSVRPGGGEIAALRDACADAAAALSAELHALGPSSLEDAETAADQRRNADARRKQVLELRRAVSEKSAGELDAELKTVVAELDALAEQPEPSLSEADARLALTAADDTVVAATERRDQTRDARGAYEGELGALRAELQGAEMQQRTAVQALEQCPSADTLNESVAQADTAERAALRAVDAARREHTAAGGDDARSAAEQAERSLGTMQQRVREARSKVDSLEGELRAIVADAPFESVQDAEGALELAAAQAARIEREAAAVMLLRTTIREERRKVVEKLVTPVLAKVRPYIANLFPGSLLDVGEELQLLGLSTGNIQEGFGFLSGGAQEQLSLLTRIGLAEVLAGGKPLPLILDDVLVNTDPERIQRVQRALFQAAKNGLQVLLFSCHDRLFDSFGADRMIQLEATRGG